MKKNLIFLLGILFLVPIQVLAKSLEFEENDSIIINETTKYYKTMMRLSNYELYSINSISLSITEEITQEEYENADIMSNNINTTIETTYKKMTTTISKSGMYYRYKIVLDWKNNPTIRSYDIIAIGHYASVTPNSGLNFSQKYCTSPSNCTTSTTGTKKITSTGAGVVFKLPVGNYTTLTQTLYFDVKKATNVTINSQKAVGDYAHAIRTINSVVANTYHIDTTGIYFTDSTTENYDAINPAIANWSGTW